MWACAKSGTHSLVYPGYFNVAQTGLAVGKQEPGLYGLKSCSWPDWEAVCLGILLVSSLFNYPLTSLVEAFYSASKLVPLPVSAAYCDAFAHRQGPRSKRNLSSQTNFGVNENLRCHSSQESFYFVGDDKIVVFNKISNMESHTCSREIWMEHFSTASNHTVLGNTKKHSFNANHVLTLFYLHYQWQLIYSWQPYEVATFIILNL